MDSTLHGVTESQTQLSSFQFHFHAIIQTIYYKLYIICNMIWYNVNYLLYYIYKILYNNDALGDPKK